VNNRSSVGVLDKVVAILEAAGSEPASLADLVARTGISRPTAHRLAVALEGHRLLRRDEAGRFRLGQALFDLAARDGEDPLIGLAAPVLRRLQQATGESCQVYRRDGGRRVCIAVADRPAGLRDSVPLGAVLPMSAGSAAQVLLAWRSPADPLPADAAFDSPTLAAVRRRGWAASAGEREAGVASVSAPVRDAQGAVVAAISVSGPIERLGRTPGGRHADAVRTAARELAAALAASGAGLAASGARAAGAGSG
jgi:DNA-binding IclR family transcriptional regulator